MRDYFTFADVAKRLGISSERTNQLGRDLDRWARRYGIEQRWASEEKTFANISVDCKQTVRRYPIQYLQRACDEMASAQQFNARQGELF